MRQGYGLGMPISRRHHSRCDLIPRKAPSVPVGAVVNRADSTTVRDPRSLGGVAIGFSLLRGGLKGKTT
jgi:hypothetical protein